MKKYFLILVFFFAVGILYAQEQTVAPITETERVVDKYLDKAGDALNSLAEALKVPAEHVYSILVRQQTVKGVISLSAFVFTFFICF